MGDEKHKDDVDLSPFARMLKNLEDIEKLGEPGPDIPESDRNQFKFSEAAENDEKLYAMEWLKNHQESKKKHSQLVQELKQYIDSIRHAVETREVGQYDDQEGNDEIAELTGKIDAASSKLIEKSQTILEHLDDYFNWESTNAKWHRQINEVAEKMAEAACDMSELIHPENIFLKAADDLQLGAFLEHPYKETDSPAPYLLLKKILFHLHLSIYGQLKDFFSHMVNLNQIDDVNKIFTKQPSFSTIGEGAVQLAMSSKILSNFEYPMEERESEEINDIILTTLEIVKQYTITLKSLSIGSGPYKPELSDQNSHVPTNFYSPRRTFNDLGMWPTEAADKYDSLFELDANNWIGIERHSQTMRIDSSMHKTTYRDIINFIQSLGYLHKKVTTYDKSKRKLPELSLFEWKGESHKFREDASIFFYNPQCPIAEEEMRIVLRSYSPPFQEPKLSIHVGLELFRNKMKSTGSALEPSIENIQLREYAENYVRKVFSSFDIYQRKHGLLKNSKFDATIKELNTKGRTFEDMILSTSKKQLLEENIFAILSNSERLIERGVETNRGIMLAGPPGVGKSLTIDALISKSECTVLFANYKMLHKNMEGIFETARRYAPTVLILEDIDALGITAQRGFGGSGAGLSTLLNCMDGINSNNGVITVATSNHPEQMDWALIARPGRFDVRLDYPYPDHALLRGILELKLKPYVCEEGIDIPKLIKIMPLGFTGSHIHDIVNQANYICVNNSTDDAKDVKITQEALESSVNRSLYNFKKFLDERPHIQLENPPSVSEILSSPANSESTFYE